METPSMPHPAVPMCYFYRTKLVVFVVVVYNPVARD
jgi:hypothetical protein